MPAIYSADRRHAEAPIPWPPLAMLLLAILASASPAQDLHQEVQSMEELATELSESIDQVKLDMQRFVEASQATRSGEANPAASTDSLVQGMEGLKTVVYRVLEQTDINNALMDSIEATIAEVKHRKTRAQGFRGEASATLVKRWEDSLLTLSRQKDGILDLRVQAQNNLTELLAKEALILELADLQDLETITEQLDTLTSGLQALSQNMRSVSETVVPVETGLPQ
jgi:prefoldin subunit 5